MGILNRTPDSFFDGGTYLATHAACERVDEFVRSGADVIDLGAESTQPGAQPISAADQLERLGGVIEYAVKSGVIVSIDTTSPEVAEHALRLGARMINSVSLDPAEALGRLAAHYGAELVLTHCRGSMTSMRGFSEYAATGYNDVVEEVTREWQQAAKYALAAGVPPERLWFDPGLGFTKNAAQSLELAVRLAECKQRLGHPILVGASRKSFVAAVVANGTELSGPANRLGGSLAAALDCAARGADMVRVHDVAETVQALAYRRAATGLAHQFAAQGRRASGRSQGGLGEQCSTD